MYLYISLTFNRYFSQGTILNFIRILKALYFNFHFLYFSCEVSTFFICITSYCDLAAVLSPQWKFSETTFYPGVLIFLAYAFWCIFFFHFFYPVLSVSVQFWEIVFCYFFIICFPPFSLFRNSMIRYLISSTEHWLFL